MTISAGEEFVNGTCEWCQCEGLVYADNGRCEECDIDVVRCSVCDEDRHYDNKCRHVFRDENWQWCGSGIGEPDDDTVELSFRRLLSLMPEQFSVDLRTAIQSGLFHTWLVAPMIGGGGILEMNGMPDRERQRNWGDKLIKIGEGHEAEETQDGYKWLASLYEDKTPDANTLTIEWIDRALCQFFADREIGSKPRVTRCTDRSKPMKSKSPTNCAR